jgi:nicotinamidase/pyrazinamidase
MIDPQKDFMPGGSLAVPGGDEIIPVINRIQEKFELVIATQDWHPRNHVSFASNHQDKKPFEKIEWRGMEQALWPDHCVQNTSGADFHPGLAMQKVEAIFRKGMDRGIDSYSGFYDNGHRKNTGLAGYLHGRNARELFFCGLASDVCVRFSILDALDEGFSAALIEDAARPIDADAFGTVRREMAAKGCKIIRSSELDAG